MGKPLTIATCNIENLFYRFRFRGVRKADGAYRPHTPDELERIANDGFSIDRKAFEATTTGERKITAALVRALRADIVGFQEVENLDVLRTFLGQFVKTKGFDNAYLIDGFDPRFIDVGVVSRFQADRIATHLYDVFPGQRNPFVRDLLEISFIINGKPLHVFVTHLKSMVGGRGKTKAKRETQCQAILSVLRQRFGEHFGDAPFILMGDFNDYYEEAAPQESGIRSLLNTPELVDVIGRLPAEERWTHYYKSGRASPYHQLDYILLSRSLAESNPTAIPSIERRGLPRRVNKGPRGVVVPEKAFFPGVTQTIKASDHCGVAITLDW